MSPRAGGGRHGELPQLELECMNVLWEGDDQTVRDVQARLAPRRPLAYTTVLTVLDRLAKKGAVTRRKSGRAHLYHAVLAREEARRLAVARLVAQLFDGSRDRLLEYLSGAAPVSSEAPARAARAAAAGSAAAAPGEGAPHLDTSLL